MGRIGNYARGVSRSFSEFFSTLKARDKNEMMSRFGEKVLRPKFIPDRYYEVTRSGQWLAAFVLIAIIPASLTIIVVFDNVMVEVFFSGEDFGEQAAIFRFVINFLDLGLFVLAAWSWYMWVRTGGFGFVAI